MENLIRLLIFLINPTTSLLIRNVRLILVEFLWHAKIIVNNKKSFEKDVIVSLDPESSYILKSNKVPYYETYQFCNQKELWFKYKEIANQSIKITETLDDALWNTDQRFKDLSWKLFNDFHFVFKISFDQLYYYSELISKLIEKFNPSEIIVADTGKILVDEYFLIDSKISVIQYLLKTIENTHNKIKVGFVTFHQNNKSKVLFFSEFKKKIYNFYHKSTFVIYCYLYKPKYLSIDCIEIKRFKQLYPKKSKFYLNYQQKNLNKKFKNNKIFFENFIKYLKIKTNFLNLIKHKNICFEIVFYEILLQFVKQLNFLIKEYDKTRKIVALMKPVCVIFQSMAPFHLSNVIFRKNCVDLKIPFLVWSHGGCGLTYSIAPYDLTDFRFCRNHIAYGTYLGDLIEDKKCILNKLNLGENQKIYPVGSLKLDYDNRKKNFKKKDDKKTILFLMGFNYKRNNFYFGRNREKRETLLWEFIYDILCILKKYQNKYNIIFKDYPEGRKSLWKKVLKDIDADKVTYVSNEFTVNDLMRRSDLNILPWISTTFFEALYFDADIFVIEEDVFEKAFEQKLKNEIFYFENADKFKLNLEKYLEDGQFYKYKKNLSKSYLLNFDNFNKRDKVLNEVLDNFSKN